jgi:hypothetical protein
LAHDRRQAQLQLFSREILVSRILEFATPEWITAFGTVGAVIVSLALALNQGQQTRQQAKRHQAELVTAWFVSYDGEQDDPHKIYAGLRITNASEQLIYDLVAEAVLAQGSGRHTALGDTDERNREYGALVGNVPPGQTTTRINTGGGGMHKRHTIELAFRDAAGRYWLRKGDGTLNRVHKHPLDLYSIQRPVSWEN